MRVPQDIGQRLLEQNPDLAGYVALLPDIGEILNRVYVRSFKTSVLADRLVVALAHVCQEDFLEILVLCGHGFGIGGLKVLRGFFERAVTLTYIAANPTEADRFLDFQPINEGKLINNARGLAQLDLFGFTEERIRKIDEGYSQAKKLYQESLCKKCGTTRLQMSWSKLDLRSMAQAADTNLAALYVSCYLIPTLFAHATVPAVLSRIQDIESGGFRYKSEAQGANVRLALIGAHNLLLRVLGVLNSFFNLGLEDEIKAQGAKFIAFLNDGQSK